MERSLTEVLDAHSAGSPTDPRVRWTDLKPMQLAKALVTFGVTLSRNTAAKLLEQAAAKTSNPSLKKFLSLRAQAFRSDDYFQS